MVIVQKTADIQQHFMRNNVSDVANDFVVEWLIKSFDSFNLRNSINCATEIKYTWMLSDIVDALPKGVEAGSFEKSHADEISQCLENHGDIELTYSMTFEPHI
jgi:hypothetical protein